MEYSIPVFFLFSFPSSFFFSSFLSLLLHYSFFDVILNPQAILDAKIESGVCFFFSRILKPVLQKQLQQRISFVIFITMASLVLWCRRGKMVLTWSLAGGSLKPRSTTCLSFNLISDFISGCLKIFICATGRMSILTLRVYSSDYFAFSK